MKRDKSILQSNLDECYICHRRREAIHEIYFGSLRQTSIKHGFYVGLCTEHHNGSNNGVHFNRELDIRLKKECQKAYEKTHTRAEFMALVGRSYLSDEDDAVEYGIRGLEEERKLTAEQRNEIDELLRRKGNEY